MQKQLLTSLFVALFIASAHSSEAHAVNQHLEELYGESFLFFFILAKMLPFAGLALFVKKCGASISLRRVQIFFITGIALGLVSGFFTEGFETAFILNDLIILASGFFLLVSTKLNQTLITALFLIFGLSLGYEHGIYFDHAHDFLWLYITVLGFGLLIFPGGSFFPGDKVKFRPAVFQISGIILIILGIAAVLLS